MTNIFKSTLVVIPARGGSKRIPNKNIKLILGQPMIFWPLSVLSKLFIAENVIVSTDSDEIKAKVETKGLKVPFRRPERLSDDFTGTAEVVQHALCWYETNVRKVEYVLTVYPTAVLLTEKDICTAMETLCNDEKCDSIMSATNFPFPIQRAVLENEKGYAEMFDPNNYLLRSQDLIEARHDAGQFYWGLADAWLENKTIISDDASPILIPRNRAMDIDTIEDWQIAEKMFEAINNKKK